MRDVMIGECSVISGRRDTIVLMTLTGTLHRACCFRSSGVQYLFHLAPILAHPPLHLLADMAADLTWHLALGSVLLTWLVDVFAAGQPGKTCRVVVLLEAYDNDDSSTSEGSSGIVKTMRMES